VIDRADVVIVGGGPAGAAAALTLTRLGASVLVTDRTTERPILGEGLPPAAVPVLSELGLENRLLGAGHRTAHGNRSTWGRSTPQDYDFVRSPYGDGWHLERADFDGMLAAAIGDTGGILERQTRVVEFRRREGGGWLLSLQNANGRREVQADFLIDASGRARWLARDLGVRSRRYDRLVGIVGVLRPERQSIDSDSFTLVEAVPQGWWYATLLPDSRLVIGYMTDADIAAERGARTVSVWMALLQETEQIYGRVTQYGYRLDSPLRVVAADSSCLEVVEGEGWCAVGDAAAAYDPLSSQGITTALASGAWAGQAIVGGRDGLGRYADRMRHMYAQYLAQWMGYYALERRWRDSTFWGRRHGVLKGLFR
jgi:flavin-dependent dehydrogenase